MYRCFPDRLWVPPSFLYNGYRVSFRGVKRPERGVNHPSPSSAEVKDRVELYIHCPCAPSWPILRRNVPLYLYLYSPLMCLHGVDRDLALGVFGSAWLNVSALVAVQCVGRIKVLVWSSASRTELWQTRFAVENFAMGNIRSETFMFTSCCYEGGGAVTRRSPSLVWSVCCNPWFCIRHPDRPDPSAAGFGRHR